MRLPLGPDRFVGLTLFKTLIITGSNLTDKVVLNLFSMIFIFHLNNNIYLNQYPMLPFVFRCNSSGRRRVADGAVAAQRQGGQHRHRALGHRGEQQRARRQKQRRALPLHIVPEVRIYK